MKISVYIIAFNEVDKIRDCINSILWADEIVVADSYSTDGTSQIAEEMGAKVIKVENVNTGGDVTRKWKSEDEDKQCE